MKKILFLFLLFCIIKEGYSADIDIEGATFEPTYTGAATYSTTVIIDTCTINKQMNFTQDKFIKPNVGCLVGLDSAQTILNNTLTSIKFLNNATSVRTAYDLGSDWSNATSSFTVPCDGYYDISMNLSADLDTATSNFNCYIYLNGVDIASTYFYTTSVSIESVNVGTIYKCSAGDLIAFKVYQVSGGAKNLSSYSYATIWLLGVY